jgi:alpha-L-rhamnosidase
VSVSWSLDEDGELQLEATLPDGVTGLVRLPDGTEQEIGSGRYERTGAAAAA